jgi:Protein prenyltransferase alpha subunit repeat
VKQMRRSDEDELQFCHELLQADRSNFSVWHYRSVLLPCVHAARGHRTVEELQAQDGDALAASDASAHPAAGVIPLYELKAEFDFVHQVRWPADAGRTVPHRLKHCTSSAARSRTAKQALPIQAL